MVHTRIIQVTAVAHDLPLYINILSATLLLPVADSYVEPALFADPVHRTVPATAIVFQP